MEDVLGSENLIDSKEVKTFDAYTRRNKHMSERTGIPNYSMCCRPLAQDYFESWVDPKNSSTALKRVTPSTITESYGTFYDAEAANDQLCDDLLTFERYAKYDVSSLEAVQIREAIIDDINRATPAAMFEGSLDEWSQKLKDGTQQSNEEFLEEMDHVSELCEANQNDSSVSELQSQNDPASK